MATLYTIGYGAGTPNRSWTCLHIGISGWVGVARGSVQTRVSTPVKSKQLWKRNLQRLGQGVKISESRVSLAALYTPNIGSMHPSTLGQRFLR